MCLRLSQAQVQNMTPISATHQDQIWMAKALVLAKRAGALKEVPVGAVIVKDGLIVAEGFNHREKWTTPLGHAELIAIQKASQKLKAWRLTGCTLYVTLEPCVMCAGALVQSRIERVVFGAIDPKGGGIKSLYQICEDPRLNHRIQITSGVLEQECSQILKDFFKERRS
jgi:tRNA(adenine34) deaminase